MKKFISMVMAAAMVVSMVPATAFAADATVAGKVVGDVTMTKAQAELFEDGDNNPVNTNVEMQLAFTTMDANAKTTGEAFDVTLYVDNAEVEQALNAGTSVGKVVRLNDNGETVVGTVTITENIAANADEDEIKVTIKECKANGTGAESNFRAGDVIIINLSDLKLGLTTTSVGTEVTIALGGDLETEAMTVVAIEKAFLDINVEGANKEVAEGDNVVLRPIVIKAKPDGQLFGTTVELRVKGGFELIKNANTAVAAFDVNGGSLGAATLNVDEDEATITSIPNNTKTLKIVDLELEAVDAKDGEIAVLEVKADGFKSDSDEAAVVVGGGVVMSVDDVDVPVMYSGTTLKEDGLTSKNDHESLEVTIKETSVDAWNTNKAWSLTLPEGVYVVDTNKTDNILTGGVNVNKTDNIVSYKASGNTASAMFTKAYAEGDYEAFLFPTKSFKVQDDKKAKLSFTLDLVADPNFEGDVVLTLEGDDIETQEVVIATFVRHTVVEGYANDVIIDYKETEVPTDVTITEAETGLWKENEKFHVGVEYIAVEEIANVEVDEASDMEIKKLSDGFKVTEKSGDEPAVVTVNGMKLYMERNIPAGSYDLWMGSTIIDRYMDEVLYGTDGATDEVTIDEVSNWFEEFAGNGRTEAIGYELEGFLNVITAGRDQDDATFTTEVIVTIGNTEFFVGGAAYTMDVPAYINADGRTMMPIRAVATALGIKEDCVRWDGESKTITILYGQRVITMKAGDRMIYINAAVMPATTAVEIVNGRAFLPLRDLAAALGVTDVAWDQATQTATLNGNY